MKVAPIAQSAGSKPLNDEEVSQPARMFKKLDGTKVNTAVSEPFRFYQYKGEASMREYSPVEAEQVAQNLSQIHQQRQDSEDLAYQSWLHAFTHFCQDDSMYRKEERRGCKTNLKVNKNLKCTLLPGDTWGNHAATKAEYLGRMQRSSAQRSKNSRSNGKVIGSIAPKYPPEWDAMEMSTLGVVEGHEHRARPLSVVEMAGRGNWKVYDDLRLLKFETARRAISKPRKVVSVAKVVQPPLDLSLYGSLANEERVLSPRKSLKVEVDDVRVVDRTTIETPEFEYSTKVLSVTIGKELCREQSLLGEFDSLEEEARYLSWLRAPEVMRFVKDTEESELVYMRKLRENPSPTFQGQLAKYGISVHDFDCLDIETIRYYSHWLMSDERMLQYRLATRQSHHVPGLCKPLRVPTSIAPALRRRYIMLWRWKTGRIPLENYESVMENISRYEKIMAMSKKAQAVATSEGFILVHCSGILDWTREEKQALMSRGYIATQMFLGVQVEIRKPQAQMTEMELDLITRPITCNIPGDDFTTESFTAYGPVAEKLAEESHRRVTDQMGKPIIGHLELGDAYALDEEIGFFLPDHDSPSLELVLEQVNR